MILNLIPGIVSVHQIKIKGKEELVERGLGYSKFMTKVARGIIHPFTGRAPPLTMGCQLPSTMPNRLGHAPRTKAGAPTIHGPLLFIIFLHKALRFLTETTLGIKHLEILCLIFV